MTNTGSKKSSASTIFRKTFAESAIGQRFGIAAAPVATATPPASDAGSVAHGDVYLIAVKDMSGIGDERIKEACRVIEALSIQVLAVNAVESEPTATGGGNDPDIGTKDSDSPKAEAGATGGVQ